MNWAKALIITWMILDATFIAYLAGARRSIQFTGVGAVTTVITHAALVIWVINA